MSTGRVIAALAAVLITAAVIRNRERLGRERTLLAFLAVAALAVYASGALSALPDFEKLIEDLAEALGGWTYVLVGGLAFLETGAFVGLIVPGETAVVVGGVIAGQGMVAIVPLIGLTWLCCYLGDSTSFLIGRRLGRDFILRRGPKLGLTKDRLEQVEAYFEHHGGKTVLVGRFIGLVRALAPFIAGSSGMRYRRFAPYSVVGTGLWSALYCLLGYIFYRSFERVTQIAGQAALAFGILVGTVLVAVYLYRRLRRPEERARLARWLERQGRRPLGRPLAALLVPLWRRILRPAWSFAEPRLRFLGRRATPGDLGLELTTLTAIAGVGLYVFALYTMVLAGDPGLTPADRELLDASAEFRARGPVEAAKLVTELGALTVTGAVVFLAAVMLALRRRLLELVALVSAFALVVLSVQLAKAGVDRPRPPGPLVSTDKASFPSGHAAYATAYVAVAVVATRVLHGLASKTALVVGALVLALLVGASRVYLHVHYWSDVVGGLGLGLGIFSLWGIGVLLARHMRQNALASPRSRESASASR